MIGPSWEIGYNNQRKIREGDITFTDNSGTVLATMDINVVRALNAVGTAAVGLIRKQMETGYKDVHPVQRVSRRTGKPLPMPPGKYPHTSIRDTSALINDVQFDIDVDEEGGSVTVGNTLEYALFVHDGTRYLKKRPYIYDAISKGWKRLQDVWAAYLAQGFNDVI